MTSKYYINPSAILFHPFLDKQNNHQTIVFNPQTEDIIKINQFGYNILKAVGENSGITLDYWQNEAKIAKFIKQMVKENIIFER